MACEPIPVLAPTSIPSPSTTALTINRSTVTSASISFGSLVAWVDVFANDFSIFADGINPLQVYNNGSRTYDLSLVAPSAALTASSEATPSNILRPEANECNSSICHFMWWDNDGVQHSSSSDPTGYITDNYQAVYEVDADDDGWASATGKYGGSGIRRNIFWRLNAASYTPDVDTGHSFRVRMSFQEDGAGGPTSDWKFQIYEGHPIDDAGAVKIHETAYDETDITASFADYDFAVTSGEASNISDYTNLFLVLNSGEQIGGSGSRNLRISHAYMTIGATGYTSLADGQYSYVYTYVRSATGAESGPSPELDYTHSGSTVMLNDLTYSADPTVDFINIYRTTIGGGEYHLVTTVPNDEAEAIPNPTEGLEDSTQDVDLADDNAIILDVARKRSYAALLPPRGRYLAAFKNRVFTAGAILDAPYTAGTAAFTANSTTVTGMGTVWTKRMEGRVIRVEGEPAVVPKSGFSPGGAVPPGMRDPSDVQTKVREKTQTYRIASVASPTSLTITQPFSESSGTWDYEVEDDRNPFMISWSFPGHPEDWPVTYGLEVPGETGEGITGLVAHLGALYIFTRDSIYRLIGDDESNFRIDQMFHGVGCVSGHTIQVVNNLMYFQSDDGWLTYDGGIQPNHISSPPASDALLRGIDRTSASVNKARGRLAVSLYDAETDSVLNFNSLNGSFEHDNAMVYDTKTGSWSIDDSPSVVSAGVVFNALGDKAHLVGDNMGNVFQLNMGTSDGVFSGTVVADVTSATATTITCSAASFLSTGDGLDGLPAYLLDADGHLTLFKILSNTGTALSTLHILPFVPTTEYRVVVGAIDWDVSTGRLNYGAPHKAKVLEYVEWVYEVTNQGELYCLIGEDNAALSFKDTRVDLTDGRGVGRVFTRARGHHIQVAMRSFVPGHDVKVISAQHFLLADGPSEAV